MLIAIRWSELLIPLLLLPVIATILILCAFAFPVTSTNARAYRLQSSDRNCHKHPAIAVGRRRQGHSHESGRGKCVTCSKFSDEITDGCPPPASTPRNRYLFLLCTRMPLHAQTQTHPHTNTLDEQPPSPSPPTHLFCLSVERARSRRKC